MSVVVRMEMPKNNCEMAVEIKGAGDWCPISARVCDYYSTKKMPDWCPIICSLPEGHGRLVDADILRAKLIEHISETNGFGKAFDETPTIVPAERSETCLD